MNSRKRTTLFIHVIMELVKANHIDGITEVDEPIHPDVSRVLDFYKRDGKRVNKLNDEEIDELLEIYQSHLDKRISQTNKVPKIVAEYDFLFDEDFYLYDDSVVIEIETFVEKSEPLLRG